MLRSRVPAMEDVGNDQSEQRKGEKDKAGAEVYQRHEDEDHDRGPGPPRSSGAGSARKRLPAAQPPRPATSARRRCGRNRSVPGPGPGECSYSRSRSFTLTRLAVWVAHYFLQVLQERPRYDEGGHADQWPSQRLEGGIPAHDLNDDQGGHGQASHPGGHRQHSHHGRDDDSPAHVAGPAPAISDAGTLLHPLRKMGGSWMSSLPGPCRSYWSCWSYPAGLIGGRPHRSLPRTPG